jgi:hypothetical protein
MVKLIKVAFKKLESSKLCQNKFIGSVWFPFVTASITIVIFACLDLLR